MRREGVGMVVTGSRLRSDAARNREAIVDAARELFSDSPDFSMCEVARRAGVGQATLYRNFPDRRALAAEVLVGQLERLTRCADDCTGDPDAFFVLLRVLVEGVIDLYALAELAQADTCVGTELELHRQRIAELMRGPLAEAKATGRLRRDASLDDVFLVLLMAQGAAARAAAACRALSLALDGLVPPGARD